MFKLLDQEFGLDKRQGLYEKLYEVEKMKITQR